jgi:hypothetical protein
MRRAARIAIWVAIGLAAGWAWLLVVLVSLAVDESVAVLAVLLLLVAVGAIVRGRRSRLAAAVAAAGVLLITLGTPLIDGEDVQSYADQREVGYGLPFRFVRADMSRWGPPPSYPWSYAWNPWEDPADVDLVRFWASYAVFAGVLALPVWLLARWRP